MFRDVPIKSTRAGMKPQEEYPALEMWLRKTGKLFYICFMTQFKLHTKKNFFYKDWFHVRDIPEKVQKQGMVETQEDYPFLEQWQKRKTTRPPYICCMDN